MLGYDSATGILAYDADGSGVGAQIQFALLGIDSHPALNGADFLVV